MSLLYFLAATMLIAFFQPPPFSYILVWGFMLAGFILTKTLSVTHIRLDRDNMLIKRGGEWYAAELNHQNDYWMTLKVRPSNNKSAWSRLMEACIAGHVFLYRDQLLKAQYRKVRSSLSVAKFVHSPNAK